MFDIGFLELLLVFVVGLFVIGPEKLPSTIKTVALWIGRLRRMFTDVQQDIQRELQIEELKRSLEEAKSQTILPPETKSPSASSNVAANPIQDTTAPMGISGDNRAMKSNDDSASEEASKVSVDVDQKEGDSAKGEATREKSVPRADDTESNPEQKLSK